MRVADELKEFLGDTVWEFLSELMDSPGYFAAYVGIFGLEIWASLDSFDTSRLDDNIVMSWLPLAIFVGALVAAVDAQKRGITRVSVAGIVFMAAWGASVVPFQEVHIWRYLLAGSFGAWIAHKTMFKGSAEERLDQQQDAAELGGRIGLHAG